MVGPAVARGCRRRTGLLTALLLSFCVSSVLGDAILTLGNRDWSSFSKVRRDFATWTSWDSSDGGVGDGVQQHILYAVDSPRFPQDGHLDQHGYWLLDFPVTYTKSENGVGVAHVIQIWVGAGYDDYGGDVTLIKLLDLPLADLEGLSVAEGMLENALQFIIPESFSPLYSAGSSRRLTLADVRGRVWSLDLTPYDDPVDDDDESQFDDPQLQFDLSELYPSLDSVSTVAMVDNRLATLAADESGAPMLFLDNVQLNGSGMEDMLVPSPGGKCLSEAGVGLLTTILWNPEGFYELFSLSFSYGPHIGDDQYEYNVSGRNSTRLEQRNCGASTATSAPILVIDSSGTALIFCQGFVTVHTTTQQAERVVPAYIHGVVWATLLTFDPEDAYQFEEATGGASSVVSWEDLREKQSQVFWLTSSNTVDQINALMESDLTTGGGNLKVSNVLQWIPDNISTTQSALEPGMTVFATAASGDFLFLSVSFQGGAHTPALVVIDVRTVDTIRSYSIILPPDGRSILQLAFDAERNCLYGMQENMMNVNGETHLVEFSATLVRIPLVSDSGATAETVVDSSGWQVVNPDVLIRTVSPHQSLEDVPSAYASYAHTWFFVDGLYGELLLIDTRDGSLYAMDVDWESADFNSRFALSMAYDSEAGVLYALAPQLSTPVFMELVAVSMATTDIDVLYSDAVTNEFILALDCATCFVAVHPGTHSLVLRSQFAAVVIPLDDGDAVLTVLDSGEWDFFMVSPTVALPAPISPFSLAIPFDDYPPGFDSTSSDTTADVVVVTSDTTISPQEPDTSDGSSHVLLFASVAGVCAIIVLVVLVTLVILAKRANGFGRGRILAHATPVFDDEISDRDL